MSIGVLAPVRDRQAAGLATSGLRRGDKLTIIGHNRVQLY
jgi:hypothetical protein